MRTISAKVENDTHDKFMEYCNQKGMTVNEALGQREAKEKIISSLKGM